MGARSGARERGAGGFAAHDAIDAQLGAWTRERTKYEVAELLQRHGVPCGPVLTGADQLDDPHFAARNYPRWIEQQDAGKMAFEGPAFRATGMQDVCRRQAPQLGEHTREICQNLLRLDDAAIDRLIAEGALEVPRRSSCRAGAGLWIWPCSAFAINGGSDRALALPTCALPTIRPGG